MKTTRLRLIRHSRNATRRSRALTLPEMMITMAIFSFVVVGIIQLHLFGLQQNELVESKLGASDEARISFGKMLNDIRGAKMWRIGDVSGGAFTAIPNGTLQQGSAVQIYPTTNSTSYVLYYFDTDAKQLRRKTSDSNAYRVIASHLTNSMFFSAEDYLGNVKTDLSYKYVIHARMEFYQYQYPTTRVGPGCLYDYYKLEFKASPHCPDGA